MQAVEEAKAGGGNMQNNLSRYQKDLGALLQLAKELYTDLLQSAKERPPKGAGNRFHTDYQLWYSESVHLIAQVLPKRLEEFERLYHDPKRKINLAEGFSIHDWLVGFRAPDDAFGRSSFNDLAIVIGKFNAQFEILRSTEKRFESSLFQIKQLLQADLFDSEIDSAAELNKRGFFRAAGAVAGVVIEKHLKQACENHQLPITKKNPTISDLNDLLKKGEVIEVPVWRFIQRLGDLRNLCDHDKKLEPDKEDVGELVEGAQKVLKTVF